jgi:hypothetical protein
MRVRGAFLPRCLMRIDPQKSVANIFLNCTKNIGLTPRPFARTFGFVFSRKQKPTRSKTVTGQR